MRLTSYANYSMRILMYCALREGELVTIADIARDFDISRAHLLKAARRLGQLGYLQTMRGRSGGVQLAMAPEEISVGEVVRALESVDEFVECFNPETNTCRIAGTCRLTGLLRRAIEAFYRELDSRTLADLVIGDPRFRQQLIEALDIS
ncbi:MAG: Rrf2 family transcriptional regulator [Halieaceae bacterium]|jgi:Rrf2 family nitric oxide-sensitive transcriptional repressor|nr:Rrf2 family transcriptional regulator [Halieaceae bacterium]